MMLSKVLWVIVIACLLDVGVNAQDEPHDAHVMAWSAAHAEATFTCYQSQHVPRLVYVDPSKPYTGEPHVPAPPRRRWHPASLNATGTRGRTEVCDRRFVRSAWWEWILRNEHAYGHAYSMFHSKLDRWK